MSFTKLRGITEAQVDEAVAALTDADLDVLDADYLGPAGVELIDWLTDPLGCAEDVDTLRLLCRIYCRILARNPETAS